ncbi:hypothetical protein TURU_119247 [Turdus rufiventris]|nr:hypothetical protein TURU_119247 [Turdus rufiventris]
MLNPSTEVVQEELAPLQKREQGVSAAQDFLELNNVGEEQSAFENKSCGLLETGISDLESKTLRYITECLKQIVAGAEKNNSGSEEREVKVQSINHTKCNQEIIQTSQAVLSGLEPFLLVKNLQRISVVGEAQFKNNGHFEGLFS